MFLVCSLWFIVPDEAMNSRTIDDFKKFETHWKGQKIASVEYADNMPRLLT